MTAVDVTHAARITAAEDRWLASARLRLTHPPVVEQGGAPAPSVVETPAAEPRDRRGAPAPTTAASTDTDTDTREATR